MLAMASAQAVAVSEAGEGESCKRFNWRWVGEKMSVG